MLRTLCTELPARAGHTVRLAGWTHRRRQLGAVSFLIVRDRSGTAQVVATGRARAAVAALTEETPVEVVGLAVANPAAPGGVEVTDPRIRPLSAPAAATPVAVYRPEPAGSLPVRLDNAPVALRHPRRAAVARIAAAAVAGMRSTLDGQGFTEVFTPKLVATATESGANVFGVDYFGRAAYLAQSPQFAKQTLVGALERVYEVGPVFRAEPHDTARHLAEYTSLDVELGFVADHTDVMAVARDVVAGMLAAVTGRAAAALDTLGLRVPEVPATVPALPFREAQRLLAAGTGGDPSGEPDLAPAHERWLGGWAAREHGSDLLFVTGYPMAGRPFYTHPDPADPGGSRGFDLLWRGAELATGGQRLHRYEDYLDALSGVDRTPYEPYLAAFRYGMPPHGGFAFGLERFVAGLVGAANVREVALFPRDAHRLRP